MPPLYPHGGNLLRASREFGMPTSAFLDFSANLNPLGPPQSVLKALRGHLALVANYPDPEGLELKMALAGYFSVEPECLVLTNGASEGILTLIQALQARRVVVPVPTFNGYAMWAEGRGIPTVQVPMTQNNGFSLVARPFAEVLQEGDVLFICNPNNPVGNVADPGQLDELMEICAKAGAFMVVDESFADFLPDRDSISVAGRVGGCRYLAVVFSLTKFYTIPGLRLGCIIAPVDLVQTLEVFRDPWNVNSLAQLAGTVAIGDVTFQHRSRMWLAREKEFFFTKLQGLAGIRPYPPEVNFILCDISSSGLTATQMARETGMRGVLVRSCVSFPTLGESHIRIAIRTRKENQILLDILKEVTLKSSKNQLD